MINIYWNILSLWHTAHYNKQENMLAGSHNRQNGIDNTNEEKPAGLSITNSAFLLSDQLTV